MDYLDKLIQLTQIAGKINVQCRFHGSWQVHHDDDPNLLGIFHIISKGKCRIKLGGEQFTLNEGDAFFIPQGKAHTLECFDTPRCQNCHCAITNQTIGDFTLKQTEQISCQGDYEFEMFCGYFYYNGNISPLFQLPDYWLLSDNSQILPLLALLRQEAQHTLGSQSTIDALCQVLLTYLIRDYLQQGTTHQILAALQDKRLYPAVNAMLLNPEHNWTMETLAELSAMSRANFIRLFKQKTNYLPGKLLTDLRMQKASLLLKNSNKSVLAIALEVGYQSEAYFSKVFKQYYQLSPARFRQQQIS